MGAHSGWEPIKLYPSLDGLDQDNLSREQIKQKVDAAKPDEVRRAGQAFLDAADLIGGRIGGNGPSEVGIQAALSRTARELARVWRGPAAEKVQTALRAMYATAGALGDAMAASGAAMSWYADVVRDAQKNFPAPSGSDEGAGGGTDGGPSPDPDEAARRHFRALNQKIQEANNAFAEGLAFDLPPIEPLDIDLTASPRIRVGGTGAPQTRSDGAWHGGSYGNDASGSGPGSAGSGVGGGNVGGGADAGFGSSGTGSGGGADGSGANGPADGSGTNGPGADGSAGPGDPGSAGTSPGPGGSWDTGQTGTGQTGDSGDGQGTAPPVIGGSDSTSLADAHALPTGTIPGGTTPPGATPNPPTGYPGSHVPLPTAGPTGALPPGGVIGTYGGPATGFGTGAAAGPGGGVLGGYRIGQSGSGSSFLPYAPAAGGGAGGQDEREREIYDPEPDVWRVTSDVSPGRIG